MIQINDIETYTFQDDTLASFMETGCTVSEIKKLMAHVDCRVTGKPRKHELVKLFSDYLLSNVKDIFDIFPLYDLMLLKDLVNAREHGIVKRSFKSRYPLVAEYSLIAYYRKKDDTTVHYVIPEDLRLAVENYLNTYKPTNEDRILWGHKQAVEGLVNLYGWIPFDELAKQMRHLFPMDGTVEIVQGMYSSLSLREHNTLYEKETIFYSPYYLWTDDVNPLPKERLKYKDIPYKSFTLPEANMAGNAFFHGYENYEERELHNQLVSEVGVSDEVANDITELIWNNVCLSCGAHDDVSRYLSHWLDPNKYPMVVALATQYVGSLPCWHLKGYTKKEMYDLRNKPAKPLTPQFPSFSGVTSPIVNTAKKIRPNDPCPCGSGMKYKKCCGKNR